MEFPAKLHARIFATGKVSNKFCVVSAVADGRVVGSHKPDREGCPPRTFNVKLHATSDGLGMFFTGSGSGQCRWYLADIGKAPESVFDL